MDRDSKPLTVAAAIAIGVVVALFSGIFLHLAGADSRGWAVLPLLAGGAAGIFSYKKFLKEA